MSKHTKGWRVGDAGHTVFGPKMPDGSLAKTIATVKCPEFARLIAAAPEMLEALKLQKAFMANIMAKGNVNWGSTFGVDFGLMNEALIAQDRAIAKAEGRS